MFYLIGLGLGDVEDVTVKGLNIIKKCSRVYLESYTSILTVDKDCLEKFYGKELILADRESVEQGFDDILREALTEDIALLVVGDPFGATTHTDIILRARGNCVPYEVVHNTSIITAVGCCGLQLYSFGEVVSIPFWMESWKPDSFFERIAENRKRGLHTLCLLDIKVKEPTPESLTRKKKEYMPPRFMRVNEAAAQLLAIVESKRSESLPCDPEESYDENTKCIGLARVGTRSQRIVYCTLKEMTLVDLGEPLHSLIIPGKLQPLEEEFVAEWTRCGENVC